MGRFWSPDPGGEKTAVPGDPGSWNRYPYVEGDPVNHGNPSGKILQWVGDGPQSVATAGYGPAGELLNLSYFGVNETRTYNSLLQLYVTSENVSYTYDALNRLTGASAGSM